jgi:hypothetical protein
MMTMHRTTCCDVCGEVAPDGYRGSPAAGHGWAHIAIGDDRGWGNVTYDLCSMACFEVVALRLKTLDVEDARRA